jgi:hypothetical protein
MNDTINIVEVTPENIAEHPQVICFINPKHESYHLKVDWLKKRFEEGLKIKMLYLNQNKKASGFIEYVPGEFAWRAVDAKGYMFIHCIWTYGKKDQNKGLGKYLIREVEKDAKKTNGVAVITSDKAFMATKEIFLKTGFEIVEESGKDQLLVKSFKKAQLPKFMNWQDELKKYQGLHILYSKQCPWVARSIEEFQAIIKERGLSINLVELKTAKEAQVAPSVYSVFNLIHNGKILADRYISATRLKNILNKEFK